MKPQIIEWAVMCETHEGNTLMMRRGFRSQEAAESHPIVSKLWKRVWVSQLEQRIAKEPAGPPELPPLPWDWQASTKSDGQNFYAYITDANKRKIAAVWGKNDEKAITADFILKAVKFYDEAGRP